MVLLLLSIANASTNTTSEQYQALRNVVESAAGVYIHPRQQELAGSRRMIIVAAVNKVFGGFFFNLQCHLERLGMKLLAISLDHIIHKRISLFGGYSYYFNGGSLGSMEDGEAMQWDEPKYQRLMVHRLEALVDILSLGYDVIWLDTDVVPVWDFMPLLSWSNMDMISSIAKKCDPSDDGSYLRKQTIKPPNGGFYMMRSNPRTMAVLERTISLYTE
jgi:hypothetical protein